MRASLRSTLVTVAATVLVAFSSVAAGGSSPSSAGSTTPATSPRSVVRTGAANAAVEARALVSPTCHTVPVTLVERDLGTSLTMSGPSSSTQILNAMGKTVLVGGRPMKVTWWSCDYDHNPTTHVGMGVSVSYLTMTTAARALTATRALCAGMRSVSPDYQAAKVGAAACLQGHTGPMQSSNAYLAEKNVVVSLFGSQSPAQSLALLRGIAPLVAKAVAVTPTLKVTTPSQYSVANGSLSVGLSCAMARCSGDATVTSSVSGSTVVLAQAPYQMSAPSHMFLNLPLTGAGSADLSIAGGPLPATLRVTVAGGATVVQTVSVSSGPSPPTTAPPTSPVTTTLGP